MAKTILNLDEVATPLRAAVEAQPSELMKAQTRVADMLRRSFKPATAITYGACSEEGSYKAAASCNQYYFCVHSEWSLQSCPNGLHWDNSQRVCNFPDAAGCTPWPIKELLYAIMGLIDYKYKTG
mgnify:CR=1 FL=1